MKTQSMIYLIPASLLCQAARMLQPVERLCFVTGVPLLEGKLVVLTQLVEVDGARSRSHVNPRPASVLQIQKQLEGMGQQLEALFHSHPGIGVSATLPSDIDRHTMRRWETSAPFLGAIFSEDGRFVRFFNGRQQSEVIVYGKCIPTEDPNCFELPDLEKPALLSGESEAAIGLSDRPAGSPELVEPRSHSWLQGLARWLRRLGQQSGKNPRSNGRRSNRSN